MGVELVVVAEDLAAEGARQAHAAVLTRHVLLERVQASLQLRALGTLEQAVALHATYRQVRTCTCIFCCLQKYAYFMYSGSGLVVLAGFIDINGGGRDNVTTLACVR